MVDYPNNPPAGVSFTSDPNLTRYAAASVTPSYNYAAGLSQANAAAQAAAQGGSSSSTAPISTPSTPAPGTVPATAAREPVAAGTASSTTTAAPGATNTSLAVPLPPGLDDIAAVASGAKDPFNTTSTTKDQSRVPATPTARSTTASPTTSASHIADVQAIFNGEVPFHELPDSFKQGVAAAFGPQAPQLYDNFRATTVARNTGTSVEQAYQQLRATSPFRTDLSRSAGDIFAAGRAAELARPSGFMPTPASPGQVAIGAGGAPPYRFQRGDPTLQLTPDQIARGANVEAAGLPPAGPAVPMSGNAPITEARTRFDTEAPAAQPPVGSDALTVVRPTAGGPTTMTPHVQPVAGVPDPRLRPGIDAEQPIGPGSSIQVQPGDNLWTIAAKVTGNREGALAYAKQIMQLNGITRPRALQPGEVIRLPGGMAASRIPNPPMRPGGPTPPVGVPARPPMGAPPPDLQFGGGGGAPGSAGTLGNTPPQIIDDLTAQAGRYATQMLNGEDIGGGFDRGYPPTDRGFPGPRDDPRYAADGFNTARGPDVAFGAGGGGDYRGRGPFGGRSSGPAVAADGYDTMRGPDVTFRPGGGFSAPAPAARDPISMGMIDPRYQMTTIQERPYEKALQDATDRAAARAGGTLRGGGGTTNFRGAGMSDILKSQPFPRQPGARDRMWDMQQQFGDTAIPGEFPYGRPPEILLRPETHDMAHDFLHRGYGEPPARPDFDNISTKPRADRPMGSVRVGSDLNRNDYASVLKQLAAMGANDNAGKWRMTRDVMPYSVRRMPMAIPLSTNIPGGRPYLPPGVIMPDNSNVQGQGRGMPAWLDRFWNWF